LLPLLLPLTGLHGRSQVHDVKVVMLLPQRLLLLLLLAGHSLVHDLKHLLGQFPQAVIKHADAGVGCSQPRVWVLDNLQRRLPLKLDHCMENNAEVTGHNLAVKAVV
jgi:hypothetical protein